MRRASVVCAVALAGSLCASPARARNPELPENGPPPGGDVTFLDHEGTGPLWLSGQANSIFQVHPSFPSAYSGRHSFSSGAASAISG